MSSQRPRLSLFETLDLGLVAVQTALTTIRAFITAPFRGHSGHQDLVTHVSFAASKTQNSRASARQLQWIYAPTDEVYYSLSKAKCFKLVSTSLAHGATAHWLGNENVDKVLVFFHGGGYVKPATTQLELLWDIQQSLSPRMAICLLSYSLAPEAQYPMQLEQAVGLLRYLETDGGKERGNIMLCGDSAGGNLVLGVLSHLLHPHPCIAPLKRREPLLGAALISPWGGFDTSASSYSRNALKDSIDASVLQKWAGYFMGRAEVDGYNQPFCAPSKWWNELNDVVQSVLITAGTNEVLVDDIKAFADRIERVHPDITTVLAAGEVHDQPFTEPLTDDEAKSEQSRALKAWLRLKV